MWHHVHCGNTQQHLNIKENGNNIMLDLSILHHPFILPFILQTLSHIHYFDNFFIKDVSYIQYSFSDFINKLSNFLIRNYYCRMNTTKALMKSNYTHVQHFSQSFEFILTYRICWRMRRTFT